MTSNPINWSRTLPTESWKSASPNKQLDSRGSINGHRLTLTKDASLKETTRKIEERALSSDLKLQRAGQKTIQQVEILNHLKSKLTATFKKHVPLLQASKQDLPDDAAQKTPLDIKKYAGELVVNKHNHEEVKSLIEAGLDHSDNLPISFQDNGEQKSLPAQFKKDLERMGSLKINGKELLSKSEVGVFKAIQNKLGLNDKKNFQLLKSVHQGLIADLTKHVRNTLLPTLGIKDPYIESVGKQNYSINYKDGIVYIAVESKIEIFKKEEVEFKKTLPNGKVFTTTEETKVSIGTMTIKREFSIPHASINDESIDTTHLNVIDTFTPLVVDTDESKKRKTVDSNDLLYAKQYKKFMESRVSM